MVDWAQSTNNKLQQGDDDDVDDHKMMTPKTTRKKKKERKKDREENPCSPFKEYYSHVMWSYRRPTLMLSFVADWTQSTN